MVLEGGYFICRFVKFYPPPPPNEFCCENQIPTPPIILLLYQTRIMKKVKNTARRQTGNTGSSTVIR